MAVSRARSPHRMLNNSRMMRDEAISLHKTRNSKYIFSLIKRYEADGQILKPNERPFFHTVRIRQASYRCL